MKVIRALTIAALLSSWLTAPSVFAQGAGIEWDILNQEVMELYRAGNYGRAVVVAKKALQVAETNAGRNHPDVAASLNNLALLYKTQGQYAQAEPLYKRSLAIMEKGSSGSCVSELQFYGSSGTRVGEMGWLKRL